MRIHIKRAYDAPDRSDGPRLLVDRLWPRGVSKEKAKIDAWLKDVTPSSELRSWFHADPEKRFAEFEKRYRAELAANRSEAKTAFAPFKSGATLVTAAKDIEHSHIPTLVSFIKKNVR